MIKKEWSSLYLFRKLFFYSFIMIGCRNQKENSKTDISILWKEGKAIGMYVPKELLGIVSKDSIKTNLQWRLAKHGEQPFLEGEYISSYDQYIFKPLIPFTRGLVYDVFIRHQFFKGIEIPKDTTVAKLIGIYPGSDTVPENLLKIYLVFSKPMVEGYSLRYIKLTSEKGDSLPGTFLNLQSELWNEEGTALTLWLDPGRIKRGLIPNEKIGSPLVNGRRYKLIISTEWKSKSGNSLEKSYSKNFVVFERDSVSPSPDKWKLVIPENNSRKPLEIYFGESLDYALIQHLIRVVDSTGGVLDGAIQIDDKQMSWRFTPSKPWSSGSYKILVEGRLEDLAGNNLNRLFDVDLKKVSTSRGSKNVFERKWQIH